MLGYLVKQVSCLIFAVLFHVISGLPYSYSYCLIVKQNIISRSVSFFFPIFTSMAHLTDDQQVLHLEKMSALLSFYFHLTSASPIFGTIL